MLWGKR